MVRAQITQLKVKIWVHFPVIMDQFLHVKNKSKFFKYILNVFKLVIRQKKKKFPPLCLNQCNLSSVDSVF